MASLKTLGTAVIATRRLSNARFLNDEQSMEEQLNNLAVALESGSMKPRDAAKVIQNTLIPKLRYDNGDIKEVVEAEVAAKELHSEMGSTMSFSAVITTGTIKSAFKTDKKNKTDADLVPVVNAFKVDEGHLPFRGPKFSPEEPIKYQTGKVAFTVKRPLGIGTFGEVHVVWSEVQKRERAMKCTRFDGMTMEQRNALYLPACREALLGVDIGAHANLITPRFVKVAAEEFLMMMDYFKDSVTLEHAIEHNLITYGTGDTSDVTGGVAYIWWQIIEAVGHMHSKDMLHLDVKPDNLLFLPAKKRVKLFDYGLTRKGNRDSNGILQVKCDGCTPAYAGPEVRQLMGKFRQGMTPPEMMRVQDANKIVPASSDLWAAALCALQLLYTTRKGVWTAGEQGTQALKSYQATSNAVRVAGRDIKDWTEQDVHTWAESQLHERHEFSIFLHCNMTGAQLVSQDKKSLRSTLIKSGAVEKVTVGLSAKLYNCIMPLKAKRCEDSLLDILEKSLKRVPAERYLRARDVSEDLRKIIDNHPNKQSYETAFSDVENLGENTQKIILVNIGNSLSNHGYFNTAKATYQRVLDMQGDRATALKGWATTLCSEFIWNTEGDANLLAETGIESVLDKCMLEVADAEGRNSLALAQSLNTLWCLCTGNGQHAEMVHAKEGFMEALPVVLDESTSEAVILACIGISGSVCVKSPERRKSMADAGVPDRLLNILQRFGYHPHIIIQTAIVMMDLAQSDEFEAMFRDNGTLKCLVESWKTYHMDNRVVSYTIPDKLYNFTFNCKETLQQLGVVDLTSACLEKFKTCVPMKKFGEDLIARF